MANKASDLHPCLAHFAAEEKDPGRGYPDLHEHLLALAREGLLTIVDEPINKDTEMHPLVRWQYRGGIPEAQRRAFLFTQPVDSKGKRYDMPVLVAGLAANPDVYRVGFGKPLDQVGATWITAIAKPVEPNIVETAPCHEIVVMGDALDAPGRGLDSLPVPISTPGFDNGPYLSSGHYITKDPDNGIQNLGNYRGQIKAPRRLGINTAIEVRAGGYAHWAKYKARGEPMPCAVVLGAPPAVSYAAVQKLPEDIDELKVAGGLVGKPINLVRAKTVDLLVPAESEIVIEGYVNTEFLEPEGPFGESHGYIALQEYNGFMDVTAITRRKSAVVTSFISQVTPSESSVIRKVALEPLFLYHLKTTLGVRGVKQVMMQEPLTSLYMVIAIQFARNTPATEIWRGLYATSTFSRIAGKWVIAVDEDIDAGNPDAIFWAMSYRCQPQHDVKILDRKDPGHGPRGARDARDNGETASVLIDATLKAPYPPVALPTREYMENARKIWERLGLPPLKPEAPWHGYDFGLWPEVFERQAQKAARSEYFELDDELIKGRRNDVPMNTPVATK
jgi:4-hydroxy-3-polyprenylbenzoate decarboxylase